MDHHRAPVVLRTGTIGKEIQQKRTDFYLVRGDFSTTLVGFSSPGYKIFEPVGNRSSVRRTTRKRENEEQVVSRRSSMVGKALDQRTKLQHWLIFL